MDTSYWLKQAPDKPLFPEILWSRPENKSGAGKLAIIGGNSHGFGAPGIAYNESSSAGVGVVRVLLPDAVKKTVRHILPDADYAPSTPSGSFARKALSDCLTLANWSDATLLAGDFGRNSETAVLLESFVQKYHGLLGVTQDAFDYFKTTPRLLVERPNTLLAISFAQLQKLYINLPSITAITYSMTDLQLAEALHSLTTEHPAAIMVRHNEQLFMAFGGRVVSQKFDTSIWRVKTAARASVFWLQNPVKTLESIASSVSES